MLNFALKMDKNVYVWVGEPIEQHKNHGIVSENLGCS